MSEEDILRAFENANLKCDERTKLDLLNNLLEMYAREITFGSKCEDSIRRQKIMDKIRVLNSLTNIRKDLAEARGYDYSGVEVLEYVIKKIDSGEWIPSEHFGERTTSDHLPKEEKLNKPITREEILNKAKQCVCGQREQDYGTPESNFQLIANLWNDYLGFVDHDYDITPTDVAMMMALLKIARIKNGGGTGDSFVDLAGYAACGGEINSSKQIDIRDLQETTDRAILEKDFNCGNCKYKMKRGSERPCDTCINNCESPCQHKTFNWEKRDE